MRAYDAVTRCLRRAVAALFSHAGNGGGAGRRALRAKRGERGNESTLNQNVLYCVSLECVSLESAVE